MVEVDPDLAVAVTLTQELLAFRPLARGISQGSLRSRGEVSPVYVYSSDRLVHPILVRQQ